MRVCESVRLNDCYVLTNLMVLFVEEIPAEEMEHNKKMLLADISDENIWIDCVEGNCTEEKGGCFIVTSLNPLMM